MLILFFFYYKHSHFSFPDESAFNEPDLVVYKNHGTENIDDIEAMFPSIRETCVHDYLMINTPHVAYVYCGMRKLAIAPICALNIIIHYQSTSLPNFFYKGFKLYFEWVEKAPGITCDGGPPVGSTTTPSEESLPTWAENLELSPKQSTHICYGTSKTLRCPRGSDYVLALMNSYYVVTGSGQCEIPVPSHCHQLVVLNGLTCTHGCLVEYNIPRTLSSCESKVADYLSIEYECIPTLLPNHELPIDICSSTIPEISVLDSGMMVSPQYPSSGGPYSCSKKIHTTNHKLWMVFIVDLYLEGDNDAGRCDTASLIIHDGVDTFTRCGSQQPQWVLTSCSNTIEFQYSITRSAAGYRGFKVYFQTMDVPSDWACKPSGFTTTPLLPTTTTAAPTSIQSNFRAKKIASFSNMYVFISSCCVWWNNK